MPILEYSCREHGRFEQIKYDSDYHMESCPVCHKMCPKVMSRPAIIRFEHKENLPLGSGSRGKYIPSSETGGLPIFVPSFGALEQAEVDDVALAATEKERERVRGKKTMRNPEKAKALENLVNTARNAPQGKRKKTLDKVLKEGMV